MKGYGKRFYSVAVCAELLFAGLAFALRLGESLSSAAVPPGLFSGPLRKLHDISLCSAAVCRARRQTLKSVCLHSLPTFLIVVYFLLLYDPLYEYLVPAAVSSDVRMPHHVAADFEARHKDRVRVFVYGKAGRPTVVTFYVLADDENTIRDLKREAAGDFSAFESLKLEWIDVFRCSYRAPGTFYPSGYQTLEASLDEKIAEIIKRNLQRLSQHSNITCVHPSLKVKEGVQTTTPCIAVHVFGKGCIPLGEKHVPPELEGIAVDVLEGYGLQCTGCPNVLRTQESRSPLKLGVSIGAKGAKLGGTLGAFVEDVDSGDVFALSCHHVMSCQGGDEQIEQPSLNDHVRALKKHLYEYKERLAKFMGLEEPAEDESDLDYDEKQKERLREESQNLKTKRDEFVEKRKSLEGALENIESQFISLYNSREGSENDTITAALRGKLNEYKKKLSEFTALATERDKEEDTVDDLNREYLNLRGRKVTYFEEVGTCLKKADLQYKMFTWCLEKHRVIAEYTCGLRDNVDLNVESVYIDAAIAKLQGKEKGRLKNPTKLVVNGREEHPKQLVSVSNAVHKCGRTTGFTEGLLETYNGFLADKTTDEIRQYHCKKFGTSTFDYNCRTYLYYCKDCSIQKLRSCWKCGATGVPVHRYALLGAYCEWCSLKRDFVPLLHGNVAREAQCLLCKEVKDCRQQYLDLHYRCSNCTPQDDNANLVGLPTSSKICQCTRCGNKGPCLPFNEDHEAVVSDGGQRVSWMRNCLLIYDAHYGRFADKGDSGAVIWKNDKEKEAVGLLFYTFISKTHNKLYGVACPMDAVLKTLAEKTGRRLRVKVD